MLKQYCVKRLTILVLSLSVFSVLFFGFLPSDTHASGGSSMADAENLSMPSKTVTSKATAIGVWGDFWNDWYSFKTSNYDGSTYTVTVTNTSSDPNARALELYLYDSTGRQLTIYTGLAYRQMTDSVIVESKDRYNNPVMLKKNTTYYVRVEYDRYTETSYSLTAKETVAKPKKIAAPIVKAGKKKLTIKYKRANYAERYQVAIKAKGGKWKIYNNGTKLSQTIKKLKKGKKYTVKVRAQRQCYNKWYTGSWSKAKTVKVK